MPDTPAPGSRCTSVREAEGTNVPALRVVQDRIQMHIKGNEVGAESLNSKMKSFRAQLRGVSDLPFFLLAHLQSSVYSWFFVTFGAGQDKEPRKQLNIGSLIPRLYSKTISRSLTLDIGE